jgi:DNA-binding CsgD family transcriptional regulator
MTKEAIASLSPMQKTCLRLVYDHLQTKEIARQLNLSRYTVESHIKSARARLGAPTRLEAARMLVATEGDNTPPRQASNLPTAIPLTPETAPQSSHSNGVSQQAEDRLRPWGSNGTIYQMLPLPKRWGDRNDLTTTQRLWQMMIIIIFICLSLGALVSSLEALRRIL